MDSSKTRSGRRRWTPKQRQRFLVRFHESKLTQRDFANQHGVGFLGELLVREKLESEGREVKHFGNQSGYDLWYGKGTVEVKIDVKASRGDPIRDEFRAWGWALLSTSKKRKLSCTHFVCIALDATLMPHAYHVIPSSKVKAFPHAAGRFKSVMHAYGSMPACTRNSPVMPEAQQSQSLISLGVAHFTC